jgi:hypothetical protein
MSSDLYWRPAVPPPPKNVLAPDLKYAISQRFWDHDGSLNGHELQVDEENAAYFEGLADAGVEGADAVVTAIREHGAILLWIEN